MPTASEIIKQQRLHKKAPTPKANIKLATQQARNCRTLRYATAGINQDDQTHAALLNWLAVDSLMRDGTINTTAQSILMCACHLADSLGVVYDRPNLRNLATKCKTTLFGLNCKSDLKKELRSIILMLHAIDEIGAECPAEVYKTCSMYSKTFDNLVQLGFISQIDEYDHFADFVRGKAVREIAKNLCKPEVATKLCLIDIAKRLTWVFNKAETVAQIMQITSITELRKHSNVLLEFCASSAGAARVCKQDLANYYHNYGFIAPDTDDLLSKLRAA